jgi:hypothetical protein
MPNSLCAFIVDKKPDAIFCPAKLSDRLAEQLDEINKIFVADIEDALKDIFGNDVYGSVGVFGKGTPPPPGYESGFGSYGPGDWEMPELPDPFEGTE